MAGIVDRTGLTTLFDDNNVRVYCNSSGDIFVEHVQSYVSIRIEAKKNGSLQFTAHGRVEPIIVSDTIGWEITRRR